MISGCWRQASLFEIKVNLLGKRKWLTWSAQTVPEAEREHITRGEGKRGWSIRGRCQICPNWEMQWRGTNTDVSETVKEQEFADMKIITDTFLDYDFREIYYFKT